MNRFSLIYSVAALGLGLSAPAAFAQNMNPHYRDLPTFVQNIADNPNDMIIVWTAKPVGTTAILLADPNDQGTAAIAVVQQNSLYGFGRAVSQNGINSADSSVHYGNASAGFAVVDFNNADGRSDYVILNGGYNNNTASNTSTIDPNNLTTDTDLTVLLMPTTFDANANAQTAELRIRDNAISIPANNSTNLMDIDLLHDTVLPMPNLIPNVLGNLDNNAHIGTALSLVDLGANQIPIGGGSAGYTPLYRFTEFDGKGPGSN